MRDAGRRRRDPYPNGCPGQALEGERPGAHRSAGAGSLGTHDQGLIITTSDFSSGARIEAERVNDVPFALMDGEQLVRLLVEHKIGVRRVPYDLIELSSTTEPERHT